MAAVLPVLRIRAPLLREDLPGLYARACAQLARARGQPLRVDVAALAPDAVAVDALARLELAARRHGCRISLQGTGQEMCQLIELMGMAEVFISPGAAAARTEGTGARYPGRT